MNVAFSALVLLAVVLPGFLFRQSFRKTEGDRVLIDARPFGRATVSAVKAAALLHGAAWAVLYLFTDYYLDVAELLALLIGKDSGGLEVAYRDLSKRWLEVSGYFLGLFTFAWGIGFLLRKVVTRYGLDRAGRWYTEFFRFDTPWYYLFKGYDETPQPALAYLACTVEVGGQCILYNGVLEDFFLNPDGSLNRVVLSEVERRPLSKDRSGAADAGDRFYPVEGTYFVIKYADMTTLNVLYAWEDTTVQAEEAPEGSSPIGERRESVPASQGSGNSASP